MFGVTDFQYSYTAASKDALADPHEEKYPSFTQVYQLETSLQTHRVSKKKKGGRLLSFG